MAAKLDEARARSTSDVENIFLLRKESGERECRFCVKAKKMAGMVVVVGQEENAEFRSLLLYVPPCVRHRDKALRLLAAELLMLLA